MSNSVLALIIALALAIAPTLSATAGPVPDWVKEMVVPDDGNQDHVVGEELC